VHHTVGWEGCVKHGHSVRYTSGGLAEHLCVLLPPATHQGLLPCPVILD
jgi:hypothetical protein